MHVLEHVWLEPHAFRGLQSVALLQPQTPETQAAPFMPTPLLQSPPLVPQAAGSVGPWHVLPSQQPPLHGPRPVQLVVQA